MMIGAIVAHAPQNAAATSGVPDAKDVAALNPGWPRRWTRRLGIS
jgi:hypothetical protein